VSRNPGGAARALAQPAPWNRFALAPFARDVVEGLTARRKTLSSKYLYDPLGSALFEAICRLPWYGVTRAEQRLLAREARAIGRAADPAFVAELGPGSGEKLALLIRGINGPLTQSHFQRQLHLHLIDISAAALDLATHTLGDLPRTKITSSRAAYEDGLREVAHVRPPQGRAMVLFLGSNIGNFDPPQATALLREVRAALRPGDTLLLGADLVKPVQDLLLAYDDPLGVTAAFNMNLLARMNSELDATFPLDRFVHRAVWDAEASRIEMHLVSLADQDVDIPGAHCRIHFRRDETIWTESSYKYDTADIERLGAEAGFVQRDQWIDRDGQFALPLFGV
jgi:dimethylhistidine N-methyltransferase